MSEVITSFQIDSKYFDSLILEIYGDEFSISDIDATCKLWFDITEAKLLRETIEKVSDSKESEGQEIVSLVRDDIQFNDYIDHISIKSLSKSQSNIILDTEIIEEFFNNLKD